MGIKALKALNVQKAINALKGTQNDLLIVVGFTTLPAKKKMSIPRERDAHLPKASWAWRFYFFFEARIPTGLNVALSRSSPYCKSEKSIGINGFSAFFKYFSFPCFRYSINKLFLSCGSHFPGAFPAYLSVLFMSSTHNGP